MRVWVLVAICGCGSHPPPAAPRAAEVAHESDEDALRAYAAKSAAIRAHMSVPALGESLDAVLQRCRAQGGEPGRSAEPNGLACEVGGVVAFSCEAVDGVTSRCTHYKEGASLAVEKERVTRIKGEPDSSSTTNGFPTYVWSGGEVVVAGYAGGVKISEGSLACHHDHGLCMSGPVTVEPGAKCGRLEVPEHGAIPRLTVTATGMSRRVDVAVSTLVAPCSRAPVIGVSRTGHAITLRLPPPSRSAEEVWSFHIHVEPLEPGTYVVRYGEDDAMSVELDPVVVR